MLCALVEGRKSVHFSHVEFLVNWQLRKKFATIGLIQKQRLILNAILLILKYALFIKRSMEKEFKK